MLVGGMVVYDEIYDVGYEGVEDDDDGIYI